MVAFDTSQKEKLVISCREALGGTAVCVFFFTIMRGKNTTPTKRPPTGFTFSCMKLIPLNSVTYDLFLFFYQDGMLLAQLFPDNSKH
jgi:hypothetical protein